MMPLSRLAAIVNVTPDSFSDGGACFSASDALAKVGEAIRDGAHAIDIGAESTRPGATPLSPREEWERLGRTLPEARKITEGEGVLLSLDTRHAETAARALEIGVDWLNDVSGGADASMLDALGNATCGVVLMHSLGVPADPGMTLPENADPVEQVMHWFSKKIPEMEKNGIARERLILDPGIGFGKTALQSLELVSRAGEFNAIGLPVLVGHSRKSFLNLFSELPAQRRDGLTRVFSWLLAQQGVTWLRVHDVRGHRRLLHYGIAKLQQ